MKKSHFIGTLALLVVSILIVGCPALTLTSETSLELQPDRSTLVAYKNVPIEELNINKSPAEATGTFTVSDKLPDGLNLDEETGTISGKTAIVMESKRYTVTFAGSEAYEGKTASTELTIEVKPVSISPSVNILQAYRNTPINEITISKSPAEATGTFTVSPGLPAGLTLDDMTGSITGTPTSITESRKYTIKFIGSNSYEDIEVSTELTIEVNSVFLSTNDLTIKATVGTDIPDILITKSPSTATGAFTVSPNLPAGLTLDEITGTISGNPTADTALKTYTIIFNGTGSFEGFSNRLKLEIIIYKYKPQTKAELITAVNSEISDQGNNANLNNINTSEIIDMSRVFNGKKTFNGNVSQWDVSNVTNMERMFAGNHKFNGDISNWNVSNVKNMSYLFNGAHKFNGDISQWDVSEATTMRSMFGGAYVFNRDISQWEVGKVTDMFFMFADARKFDKEISKWDVSKVKNMSFMFSSAYVFNADISDWNVGNVTNMELMFYDARLFNQNISAWDVSKVTKYTGFSYNSALTDANTPKFVKSS